jgi:hypothetical protein
MPTVFLRRLIAIGESQNFSELQQLFVEFPLNSVGHFMRQAPQFWYSVADSLSDAELESLIRALTIAERDFPLFGGGSVSGVIWTFNGLQQRKRCRPDALADWVLAHTSNDCAPFGKCNGGARSITEWDSYCRTRAECHTAHRQLENEQRTIATERKVEKATQTIFSAIRRKDTKAVQALLLRGARLDVPDATTGMTALAYAQALGHKPILELLQNNRPAT